jgi:2-polyprenyl-6-methoxyphenol hydroxylase-like FAD-dependent oxidoreductase
VCHSRYPDLKTYFEYELKSVDTTTNTASFRLSSKNFFSQKPEVVEVKYDLLVGADGVNSAVRSEMIQLESSGTSSPKK